MTEQVDASGEVAVAKQPFTDAASKIVIAVLTFLVIGAIGSGFAMYTSNIVAQIERAAIMAKLDELTQRVEGIGPLEQRVGRMEDQKVIQAAYDIAQDKKIRELSEAVFNGKRRR